MKFSVVIPTLNEEDYVGNILTCLVNQTHKDLKITVVDAPSADKTKEKVLEFEKDLDLQFVVSPKKGVANQRNFGAKKGRSSYVVFFDADVVIQPDFFEKLNIFLENHPETDVLTSWNIPLSERKRYKAFFWGFNQIYLEGLKKIDPVAVGTFICVKRKVFSEMKGFDPEVALAEDYDLAGRIHKKGYKYVLLRDPVVFFSTRRYEETGRLKMLWVALRAGVYYHTKGSITDSKIFDYPMDGLSRLNKKVKNDSRVKKIRKRISSGRTHP
jgi:glycosyltransferase involved in cell wall biosynthesis